MSDTMKRNGQDLVRREDVIAVIDAVDWHHINRNGEMVHGANSKEHQAWYKADEIYKAIEAVPTAKALTGVWVKLYEGQKNSICSECCAEVGRQTNYCPNCGARMGETIVNDGQTDCPWK